MQEKVKAECTKEVIKEQQPAENLSAMVRRLLQYKCCKPQSSVLVYSKVSWINQQTRLFHYNERAIFCWLTREKVRGATVHKAGSKIPTC